MRRARATALLLAALCVAWLGPAGDAGAQFSSGGYSEPSSGYPTPARRPSSSGSGGYALPSGGSYATGTTGSGSDRAFSRRGSAAALQQYRTPQSPPPAPAPYPTRRPQAWNQGGYAANARRPSSSGFGTGFAAGAVLGALTAPDRGRAAPLRDAQGRFATAENAVPPKPPPLPAEPPAGGGASFGWIIVLVLVGGFVGLWLLRRRAAAGVGGAPARPPAPGSAAAGLRVGMTLPVDPAPFALAAGRTKVKPPSGDGMVSVEAIGRLTDGTVTLHRLYLPGREGYFQVLAGTGAQVEECRYFSLLDEVQPGSAQEWDVWLGEQQGLIGWPAFQTKDGRTYGRLWSPGNARIPPRDLTESIKAAAGRSERRLHAMLYAAPTDAPAPAPPTEYVLVAAIEADGQAWVEIATGIDINPAALNLPSVPLS